MYYQSSLSKSQNYVVLFSFYSLIILRFIVLTLLNILGLDKNLLWAIFDIGTYLFSATLIWVERRNLKSFNIDRMAIYLFIFLKPLEPIALKLLFNSQSFTALGNWGGNVICIMSVLFLFVYTRFKEQFIFYNDTRILKVILLGFAFGIISVLSIAFPMSLQVNQLSSKDALNNVFTLNSLIMVFYQMGYAAISEEPLFRGFIYGYLHMKGVKPFLNIAIQTMLFTIGHLYYFERNPISLFIVVPIGGIILGYVAHKAKSISASIIAHGVTNGIGTQFSILVSSIFH